MKKKSIIGIIFGVGFIFVSFYFLKYYLFPFGAPIISSSPNCGPEDRYNFNVSINSKEEFVDFIKVNKINQWVKLDNFRNGFDGEVNWSKVISNVKVQRAGFKKIYILDYNPDTCSGFTLKMLSDGQVSIYGCCGK